MQTASVSIEEMHKAIARQLLDQIPMRRRSDPAQCVVQVGSLFPHLQQERRPTVATAAAAHYLNRRPQTLRSWACLENGPLRPIRIHGRLAWKTEDIRRVLGVS